MSSTRSCLKHKTLFEGSNPPPTLMTDTDALQQLQNHIAKMERHHEEELRKLKAYHDQLEACVKCPQGDKHSVHTLPGYTQGESHPRHTFKTQNDSSLSHIHHPIGQTTHRYPFVDRIMETDLTLGWKPLNLEWYNGTIDPYEHLGAFLTQENLYTNDNAFLCHVFPMSLKGTTLTWYDGLPPKSIESFDTLVYQTPQTNSQKEATNKFILNALHTRLDKSKGLWKEEFPSILWAHH